MKPFLIFCFSVFTVIVATGSAAQSQDDFMNFKRSSDKKVTARNIAVEGAHRVDPATVISYMNIKPGDEFSQSDLSEALKNLYGTGLFADVNIRQNGRDLVVEIVENPVINRVAFEGNKRIEDIELASEISTRPRTVYQRNAIRADVDRIQELYRRSGRYSVEVTPKVIRMDQNRINVAFEIVEGDVTEIQGIKFIGNSKFDDDTLRSEISSEETRWYNFITGADRYDPDRMAYDQELLRRFYLRNGYVDFRVVSAVAELTPDKESFFLTFTIDEGERYKVASVNVDVNELRNANPSDFDQDIFVKKDEYYSSKDVEKTIDSMTDRLGDMQYAFARVRPNVRRNRNDQTVDITFQAQETQRTFVERIDIKGNVRTLDKVIRREMELTEGDPFSATKLTKSERQIRNLNYFANVGVKPVPGSAPDQTVVEINVEEQSTGEVSVGAGFSTSDGPLADLRIRERNLLGKGQDLLFATTLAGERTQFDISFTEPYFLNRDLSAGIDLFHITRDLQDESSYDQKVSGAALRTSYPLSENLRQQLRYRIETNEVDDVDAGASRFIRDQEGERSTSAISQNLTYTDLDSMINPTDGHRLWFSTELAGLGGDAKYVSAALGAAYFYPVTESVTFSLVGETSAIEAYDDDKVRINERFFLGSKSLRGFESAGIGPRDTATDDALGGRYFYRGSAEASFPIGLPEEFGIKGHLFSDLGSLWESDESGTNVEDESNLRASVGFGLSWQSPMGPLRVDVAAPVLEEDYDKDEIFRFDFGTRF